MWICPFLCAFHASDGSGHQWKLYAKYSHEFSLSDWDYSSILSKWEQFHTLNHNCYEHIDITPVFLVQEMQKVWAIHNMSLNMHIQMCAFFLQCRMWIWLWMPSGKTPSAYVIHLQKKAFACFDCNLLCRGFESKFDANASRSGC